MFSLVSGRKIARIKEARVKRKGRRKGRAKARFVYITEIDKDGQREFKLGKGETLQVLPNRKIVEKIYVSAPSGAGKSYWCGAWLKEYRRMYKDDEVFVLSSIQADKALDQVDPIRIKLDAEFIADPIHPSEVENSVVVFDDCGSIRGTMLRKSINEFADYLLEQGRHYNARMLITSHLVSNYKETRRTLNEMTALVCFPKAGSTRGIRQYMDTYLGLSKKTIKRILALPSRWVLIHVHAPQYVLYETGGFMLSIDEEEQ